MREYDLPRLPESNGDEFAGWQFIGKHGWAVPIANHMFQTPRVVDGVIIHVRYIILNSTKEVRKNNR